jgi:hypothetical protein
LTKISWNLREKGLGNSEMVMDFLALVGVQTLYTCAYTNMYHTFDNCSTQAVTVAQWKDRAPVASEFLV